MNSGPLKSIVLLLLGAFFLYFSNGRYSFALAAWLFPVFFLQVSRREKSIYSWLVIPLIFGAVCQMSFWKFTYDNPSSILFFLPFILGIPMGLLFYADKILYSKNSGFSKTLIFPLIYTSFDFSLNLFNPFGTLGILGYSQYNFFSFSQLASITGMWGLTFMITWFGSITYWVMENYSFKEKIRKGLIIYLSIFIAILIYGGIRLSWPLGDNKVKIAGIHCQDKNVYGAQMNECLEKKDTAAFKLLSDSLVNRLIFETRKQAKEGAKIIVWSEIASKILQKDEDSLKNVFKNLARQQKIYLLATPYTIAPNISFEFLANDAEKVSDTKTEIKSENKALLFDPNGELLLTHYKYGGNFMEGTVQGDKNIKAVLTEYGKLSAIICWDGDFPSVVKQVGKAQTDILLIPASDWRQIDPAHSIVAVFRGIENGCSVVRQTRNGLSIMTDPRGKLIAEMDHFKNTSWVTVGEVPTTKMFTLYPVIGDVVGWLSLLGVLYFVYMSTFRKTRRELK